MDMLTTHPSLPRRPVAACCFVLAAAARRQGSQLIRERDEARNALNHYPTRWTAIFWKPPIWSTT